jgi:broad specificity phosphatase PhoE
MSATTTFHFVRHGEVHNPQQIYYGRLPDFHLSAEGRRQASAAANILGRYKVSVIYSSPLERTIETAEAIAKPLGLPIQTSELLGEVRSPFDGQPIGVLEERGWDIYTGSSSAFEQPIDVLGRAKKFVLLTRKESQGKQVVVVTHGDVIAFMVLWAKQLPITPKHKTVLYKSSITPASISSFTFKTDLEAELPQCEYPLPAP